MVILSLTDRAALALRQLMAEKHRLGPDLLEVQIKLEASLKRPAVKSKHEKRPALRLIPTEDRDS